MRRIDLGSGDVAKIQASTPQKDAGVLSGVRNARDVYLLSPLKCPQEKVLFHTEWSQAHTFGRDQVEHPKSLPDAGWEVDSEAREALVAAGNG